MSPIRAWRRVLAGVLAKRGIGAGVSRRRRAGRADHRHDVTRLGGRRRRGDTARSTRVLGLAPRRGSARRRRGAQRRLSCGGAGGWAGAVRDAVVLNAAAALVATKARSLRRWSPTRAALVRCEAALDDGSGARNWRAGSLRAKPPAAARSPLLAEGERRLEVVLRVGAEGDVGLGRAHAGRPCSAARRSRRRAPRAGAPGRWPPDRSRR